MCLIIIYIFDFSGIFFVTQAFHKSLINGVNTGDMMIISCGIFIDMEHAEKLKYDLAKQPYPKN